MSSGEATQHTYSTIDDQSEVSAPTTSTKPVVTHDAENDRTQPSAPPLTNNAAGTRPVGDRPSPVNNASVPPAYAVVKRRPKPAVITAADNDRTQPSASPRSSANDLTLVDNDLYG